jgi:hypothetical protein
MNTQIRKGQPMYILSCERLKETAAIINCTCVGIIVLV